ncbi:MAG TPA: AraC family transcriptional regulator [Flavisolibacter sp.]|nr:AraC family transcriptional regulator [Flavisolibacter sp.]
MVVKEAFEKAGIPTVSVVMGEVELSQALTESQRSELNAKLTDLGFKILDDKNHQLIEKIKKVLILQVQSGYIDEHFSIIQFLAKKINKEYTQLSRLFSEVEGMTIEQFFLLQKIEKVKEWLVYNELTISEIAWKLGYSSVPHLSAQFKKITGLTPSQFKAIGNKNRKPLDQING